MLRPDPNYSKYLELTEEVRAACMEKQPVVALESTIISHGMPYPKNVETALQVEEDVRQNGAIPATIAILGGKMKAGLSRDEIEQLGRLGTSTIKCSRRDLPFVLTKKLSGATTVAATMIIAERACIPIFATGGIGGVHRGAVETMDISADLQELANTNVAVVCAGAKAILDLDLTLEYLETHGVPVIGFQTDEFPAFFSRESGLKVDYRVESEAAIAQILHTKWSLDMNGGAVIANPIPRAFELPEKTMQKAIESALTAASLKGIKGKEITPFLLAKVEELTKGDSLRSNIGLVRNNARLAACLAREYALISC